MFAEHPCPLASTQGNVCKSSHMHVQDPDVETVTCFACMLRENSSVLTELAHSCDMALCDATPKPSTTAVSVPPSAERKSLVQSTCILQEPSPPSTPELHVSRPPDTTVRDRLSDAADCSSCDHSQDYAANSASGAAVARGRSGVTTIERESEPLLAENEDRFCMYPIRFAHPAHRFPAKP